uniref:polyadenylate-binding protein 3-like n=1 Tax=Fragaria vesca subsp. vesca TaxID=101020 RepID=UPI0005C80D4E|nr:PREDICTED: polyadenylate-binding protein 3-like [Fragaria vesca subsp. vesca]
MDADDGFQQTWNGQSRVWVAYACTTEEVQQHFESYRTVNRVIMLTDKCGQPKGFAYAEFPEAEAVQEALALNESELHGRPLKDQRSRIQAIPPWTYNLYMGNCFRGPYVPCYFYSRYGYGNVPRFRRPAGYMPYC